MGYLVKSGYHQLKILNSRVKIDKVLADPATNDLVKHKLRLALSAKEFGEKELGLKRTGNFTSYVELDRPFVTHIVQAAEAYSLTPYQWRFPLVGKVPYKGYFSLEDAKEEAASFDSKKYDTYVRGVTAYSTLGWFDDPVLSTMVSYQDSDLVNLILHESVHATLYIRGHADFNEQLATFIGDHGTEKYFLQLEGPDSPTIKKIHEESHDNRMFSDFITQELEMLKKWYEDHSGQITPEMKQNRLKEIQVTFSQRVLPQLRTDRFKDFAKVELNNAKLLAHKTYMANFADFKELLEIHKGDLKAFIQFCKNLEKKSEPQKEIARFIKSHSG